MTRRWLLTTALAVNASVATALAFQVYRVRADVVVIDVAVADGKRAVPDLTKNDFELRDNGVVQTILDFDHGVLPIDVTLTIDISGSMTRQKRMAVERAVGQVSGLLREVDRGAVWTFGRTLAESTPLRHPPISVDLSSLGTGTSIYDALLLALVVPPAPDRRQLNVFMTDGDDTTSMFDEETVLATAKHTQGQMSFVIVKGGGTDADGDVMRTFRTISRTTGGEILQIDQDEQLSQAFITALQNFRTAYVLRYTPTGVAAPGWHEVTVKVKSKNYNIRARRGYQGG
jgi:Mg-chelatase subunit ChlD